MLHRQICLCKDIVRNILMLLRFCALVFCVSRMDNVDCGDADNLDSGDGFCYDNIYLHHPTPDCFKFFIQHALFISLSLQPFIL